MKLYTDKRVVLGFALSVVALLVFASDACRNNLDFLEPRQQKLPFFIRIEFPVTPRQTSNR